MTQAHIELDMNLIISAWVMISKNKIQIPAIRITDENELKLENKPK
jgi:hypothetical protein